MIPTFNQAEYLSRAITSALAQAYENLEVVVGDDASSDGTPWLMQKFKDPRLRYVRNEQNVGRVANYRLLLYEHTTGDFIVNLDGDDYFTDTRFISDAIDLIRTRTRTVIVAGRAVIRDSRRERVSSIPSRGEYKGTEVLLRMPDARFHLVHMATLYDRALALSLAFYRSPAISSDWESLYRLMLRGNVCYINRAVGVWNVHPKGVSSSTDWMALLGNLEIWRPIYRDAVAEGMSPLLATLAAARCSARFASIGCVRLIRSKKGGVLAFLKGCVTRHKLASLFLVLGPGNVARVLIALAWRGRERRRVGG
jgi:glycosyltransferase involved in cell wall biosynthesis